MPPLKSSVSGLIGRVVWSRLGRARIQVTTCLAAGVAAVLRAAAPRVGVSLKRQLRLTAPLDYPKTRILLNVDSELEQASRVNACAKEPETIEWLEQYVSAGAVLYDIGANVGAYSLVADAVAGGQARVYAFEPAFMNFAQLSRNILLNGCSGRVVPLHVALHDTTTLTEFMFSDLTAGAALHAMNESIDQKGVPFTPAATQPVLAYRLDDLVRQFHLPQPTIVKIDVDGHEGAVIDGARGVFSSGELRSVLIEIEPGSQRAARCIAQLESFGLRQTATFAHGDANAASNLIFTRAAATKTPAGG